VDGIEDCDPGQLTTWLIEVVCGGTGVTDYIGYHAHRSGYHGILFFGARAITELDRWALENARPYDDLDWICNNYEVIRNLGSNLDYCNLVVFSGARLVGATKTYRCDGPKRRFWGRKKGMLIANLYWSWDEERLLALSQEFGSDYQESRSRGFFTTKPRYR
jgi:hypothetical protein